MKRSTRLALASIGAALALASVAAPVGAHPIDRIFVIMMENQSFDNVIGRHDAAHVTLADTPFITALAQDNGLATLYFGTTHPSLPNYVALIAPSFPYGGVYRGGHTVTIVVSGTHGGSINSAVPYNEYSPLSTIENVWGLPLLGKTADTANVRPMTDLIP